MTIPMNAKTRPSNLFNTCVILALAFWSNNLHAQPSQLADRAYQVLQKHCSKCHSEDFAIPGLDVLDRRSLTDGSYIVPGDLEGSELWQRVGVAGDMPPEDETQLTESEVGLLKQWIEKDAPFPSLNARPFVRISETMTLIRDLLRQSDPQDRKFLRFFSLANLNNNWSSVTPDEYLLYQAALSKAVNSLSWKRQIVPPAPVDINSTLFVVDLRDYGWERLNVWNELLAAYPYSLRYDETADSQLNAVAQEVQLLSGSDVAFVRADWFISNATRPPLYHDILQLPKTTYELEKLLGVNADQDFLASRLHRAGFATSGVSGQNRLVDRHETVYGMYWKSFDFRTSTGRGNIFQFPLGPTFSGNPYPEQTFEHDGGEMIFTLPNGLQAYYLTDGQGNRIDAGPEDVVSDRLKTSGTSAILNGVSCMACHKNGVIRLEDTVRQGIAVFGAAREKANELFPRASQLNELLDRDESAFLDALQKTIGHLMLPGVDLKTYPEPIGAIARRYNQDLGPESIAAELGIENVSGMKDIIRSSSRLRSLGLVPLANDQKIKREMWESLESTISTYQLTALELEIGSPHRVFP